MARTKPSHVHQYQRVEWGKNRTVIWRCVLTGCNHYKHDGFIENSRSLCNKCRSIFVMTKDKARRKKPKCDRCQTKSDPLMAKLDEVLKGLD